MIRRRLEEDDDNPERWLVSYADFITLLFAFFVVMYAVSSVNQNKYDKLSSSINKAFSQDKKQQKESESNRNGQPTVPDTQPKEPAPLPVDTQTRILQQERDEMTALGENLSKTLAPLIKEGQARVMQNSQGLQIDIKDSALFAAGSADLLESAETVLAKLTTLLQQSQHAIVVEGHTDNTPIHLQNAAFFSNWELSAVRASSVTSKLNALGINRLRLSALGFGPSQPISDNLTEENRATNRHISIVILYDQLNSRGSHSVEIRPHQNITPKS